RTLRQHILRPFERLLRIEVELRSVEAELAADGHGGRLDGLLERHSRLLHEYEYHGGYTYQNRMREVLAGLGIEEERLDQPLESFSGGQRTRVALAELLLAGRDLLLLDEPTNHLDLAATEWLETYLTQTRQAIVVVSHDRYFLDEVAIRTWEMSDGRLEAYTGNYSQFAAQRAERRLRLQREYEAQQEHIARTEAYIRRYKAGQRARSARGRQKQLDRLARVARPRDPTQLKLTVQSTLRSGDTVLATEDLVVAAGTPAPPPVRVAPGQPVIRDAPRGRPLPADAVLFRCPDVELLRGERVAIVGPNGAGKTTFLRLITGEAEPAAGRIYVGYGVQLAYYAQAHEQLDPRNTVIGEILAAKPMGEEAVRTYLGRFLFTGDDAFQPVSSLSGGERSRLALAKMALSSANFLVLDEPTNHLDVYAREALEEVLASFGGTILFVSHDRYLIDALATQVWEVAGATLTVHQGSWADYLETRRRAQAEREAQEAAERAAAVASDPALVTAQQARERAKQVTTQRQRLAQIEADMAACEVRLQGITSQLEAASAAADAMQIADLGRQHVAAAAALAEREDEWLTVREALETLEAADTREPKTVQDGRRTVR
ncbi:MAG: ABC-F family ATP-binding cassette domain-containing protein, partial [Chloroflexota bacterium]